MAPPDQRLIFDAILTALGEGTGLQVGDHQAPEPDTGTPAFPYLVVEQQPGGGSAGDVSDPHRHLTVVVQVTGVGERRDQAQWATARAHDTMLHRAAGGWVTPIEIEGHTVVAREHLESGGVDREGPMWNAVERYALEVARG